MAIVRRSFALRALPVLLVVGLYALFSRGTDWRGEWAWTVDWATGTTALIATLTAGVAAWEARQAQEVQRRLFDSTVRRTRAALVPVALSAAGGVVCFGVVLATSVVMTISAGARPSADVRMPVLGVLAIVAAASIGALMGWTWPSVLTPPLAVAAVFALALLSGTTSFPAIVRVGGSTGTLVGLTTSSAFVVLTGALALMTIVTCLLRLTVRSAAGRVATAIAAAVTLGLVGVGWAEPRQDLRVDDSSPRPTCSQTTPAVCLSPQTSRLSASLPADLARASAPLRRAGIATPLRFTQVIPGQRITQGAPLFLESFEVNQERLGRGSVRRALTMPAACPQDAGPTGPPESVFSARATLEAWLAIRSGDARPADFRSEPDAGWLARPTADQVGWLRSTYDRLSDCELDSVVSAPNTGG